MSAAAVAATPSTRPAPDSLSTSPIKTYLYHIFDGLINHDGLSGLSSFVCDKPTDAVLISASFFAGLAIGVVLRRYQKNPLTQVADQIV